MRMKGTLVEWNDDRGFGFVEPVAGGGRAFCHISQFALRSRRPVVGERVTYETSRDERGRLRALKIQPAHAPRANEIRIPPWMSPWVAVLVSVMFLISIGGLAVTGHLPWIAPVVYLLASVVTIVAYAFDKSAAMIGRWRTKESTLHLLALVGGWPGAWISQLLFRHKTVKSAFIAGFVLSVLLNLAALVWIVIEPHGPLGEFLWQIERP
jgi:uncharacterized membrane protein YsdA (DUF1294 family)/cold shock CspA family protein